MSGSYPSHRGLGCDAQQAIARAAAGMELPRRVKPKSTEKLVAPIVVLECSKCLHLNAKIPNGKRADCEWCGAKNLGMRWEVLA